MRNVKIAVSGKGGSGKTTIAGTMARLLGRAGRPVIAIDADTNPNLALTLGLSLNVVDEMQPLPHGLMEHKRVNGETQLSLSRPVDDVTEQYSRACPDNVRLLMVGQVRGAGTG
jgi:CO dehydrogenase maturation factor